MANPSQISNLDSQIEVEVPTWRPDLIAEIDLIEEVARLHGYDQIASEVHRGVAPHAGENPLMRLERQARDALVGLGLNEIVTFSLTNPAAIARAGWEPGFGEPFVLRNPLSEDATQLRTRLEPGLLEVLARNARVGTKDVHVFELARVYWRQENEPLAHECRMVGIALMGQNFSARWNLKGESVIADFFMLKGIVEELLRALHITDYEFQQAMAPNLHPLRSAHVRIASITDGTAGSIGEVLPPIAERYDLPERAYLAVLNFEVLAEAAAKSLPRCQPLPRFPAVVRDLAVLVAETVSAQSVESVIRKCGGSDLRRVAVFDVFHGESLPPGMKSLAFSLTFRHDDRTLVDHEVEAAMTRIREALAADLHATLR